MPILKLIIGGVIGAILGFVYHHKIGCASGACPLTSTAAGAVISFAILGAMFGSAV